MDCLGIAWAGRPHRRLREIVNMGSSQKSKKPRKRKLGGAALMSVLSAAKKGRRVGKKPPECRANRSTTDDLVAEMESQRLAIENKNKEFGDLGDLVHKLMQDVEAARSKTRTL